MSDFRVKELRNELKRGSVAEMIENVLELTIFSLSNAAFAEVQ
jgi:hypothetical protein